MPFAPFLACLDVWTILCVSDLSILGPESSQTLNLVEMIRIPTTENLWHAVGAVFGMSKLLEITLYLFVEDVNPELSMLCPDPSQTINLVK